MADSFGDLLRRFRIAASLTQEALADRCRISPATVAAIEQGRRKAPRLSTVRLIADALELPAADRELLARAADREVIARAAEHGADTEPGDTGISEAEAPALAPAPASHVVGLPMPRTSFVGREAEQSIILTALADSQLVTLVGPGGVGKTRLAARCAQLAAASYPVPPVFVDLVPVREGFIGQAVAAHLGVTEGPGRPLDAALHEHLASGPSLLVLDNCEHLLEVVAAFAEKLLVNCGELTILATSRERLAIPGERTVIIPPLSLAGNGRMGTAGSEAESLFLDRARAINPEFSAIPEVVGQICTRLDGVPLAIELAAARSTSLGVDGLLAGLDDHLRLLAGSRGAHERHRSLRAVIDWSHDLLDADERIMFRRTGVFVGGFDLKAAAAVAPGITPSDVADLIGRLTDKSLLIRRPGPDGSRWQMLEVIRAYAVDQLTDSAEDSEVRDAHLEWAALVAAELERRAEADSQWRSAFDTVADDLRAALARPPGTATRAVSHRLARCLGHLAYARRFLVEAREHYRVAADRAGNPGEAAADLRSAADVALAEGHHGDLAFELLLASADRAAEAGDNSARAAALGYAVIIADRFCAEFSEEIPHERLTAILEEAVGVCPEGDQLAGAYLAAAAAWIAQPEKTVPELALAEEAVAAARLTGDPVLISGALDAVVGALDAGGRLRQAHKVNSERADLMAQLPRHDPRAGTEIIDTFHMVTEIAVTAGDLPAALSTALLAGGDDIIGEQPHRTASKPILPLVLQGRFDEAFDRAAEMWEAWNNAGQPAARWMGKAVYGVVLGYGLRGDEASRREWLARLAEFLGAGSDQVTAGNLEAAAAFTDARIALHEGRLDAAVAAITDVDGDSQPWYETPHWYSLRPYAWATAAEVAVVAGLPEASSRLAAAEPAGAENYWAAACLARALGRFHDDRESIERSVAGWEHIGARFERACTLLLLPDRAAEGLAELAELRCQPPAG
jgi:predicted ATPase/transcriptional regulator with XRE-family HTH domain